LGYLVAVRHAVLPIAAALVLGLGVYLFVEVRAKPAAPKIDPVSRPMAPAAPAVPQVAVPGEVAGAAPRPASMPAPAIPPRPPVTSEPRDPSAGSVQAPEAALTGPKLDAVMAEANKAYDRGDFDDAKTIAARLLATFPTNVRMLRIMVSASCIEGDSVVAEAHYRKLPPSDREQMKVRCARYGVTFSDKP
jgi:hypothetical protein